MNLKFIFIFLFFLKNGIYSCNNNNFIIEYNYPPLNKSYNNNFPSNNNIVCVYQEDPENINNNNPIVYNYPKKQTLIYDFYKENNLKVPYYADIFKQKN